MFNVKNMPVAFKSLFLTPLWHNKHVSMLLHDVLSVNMISWHTACVLSRHNELLEYHAGCRQRFMRTNQRHLTSKHVQPTTPQCGRNEEFQTFVYNVFMRMNSFSAYTMCNCVTWCVSASMHVHQTSSTHATQMWDAGMCVVVTAAKQPSLANVPFCACNQP